MLFQLRPHLLSVSFLSALRSCFELIAGYLTKNRSEKDQKIAQSTHENGYIKPRKTFCRNSKQLLNVLSTECHLQH